MPISQVGKVLGLSAAAMLVAAAVVAVAVDPLWGLLVGLVAVADAVLAVLLGSGAIGGPSAGSASGTGTPAAASDPDSDLGTLGDGTPIRKDENPLVED